MCSNARLKFRIDDQVAFHTRGNYLLQNLVNLRSKTVYLPKVLLSQFQSLLLIVGLLACLVSKFPCEFLKKLQCCLNSRGKCKKLQFAYFAFADKTQPLIQCAVNTHHHQVSSRLVQYLCPLKIKITQLPGGFCLNMFMPVHEVQFHPIYRIKK